MAPRARARRLTRQRAAARERRLRARVRRIAGVARDASRSPAERLEAVHALGAITKAKRTPAAAVIDAADVLLEIVLSEARPRLADLFNMPTITHAKKTVSDSPSGVSIP